MLGRGLPAASSQDGSLAYHDSYPVSQYQFWSGKRTEAETGFYLVVFSHLILKFHPVAHPGPGWLEPVAPEPDQRRGWEPAFHLLPDCSRPRPRCHSPQHCKLLRAASQPHLFLSMWTEAGYLVGRHPRVSSSPGIITPVVKRTGLGPLATPLRNKTSLSLGGDSPRVGTHSGQETREGGG